MRILMCSLVAVLLGAIAWGQQAPPPQPQRPLYTAIRGEVPPQVRQGRTFVPVRVIAEQFGANVQWLPAQQEVLIQQQGQPDIRLTINSRTAQVGGDTATLDAAPFIDQGRTMVPLRFIAETYNTPVQYQQQTRDVLLYRSDRVYVLPLTSTATGITIADPQQGELVRNPVRVQGVANVYEGALIIEVRDTRGKVLGRTTATAGMGGFYPFSTQVYYNLPSEDAIPGRIVVYAQDGKGDGKVLAEDSVDTILASTI